MKVLSKSALWCFDIFTPSRNQSILFKSILWGFFVTLAVSFTWSYKSIEVAITKEMVHKKFQLIPLDQRKYDTIWSDCLNLEDYMRSFS